MPLYVKRVEQNSNFSVRSYSEFTVTVEFYVTGNNPLEEINRIYNLVDRNAAVVLTAEGEEMPCATDHSEPWPGITDV